MLRTLTSLGLMLLASCTIAASPAPYSGGPGPSQPEPVQPEPARASGSRARITVPNLFRMQERDAIAALREAGFTGRLSYNQSACPSVVDGHIIETGQICYQHPPAGRLQGARLPISVTVQRDNPRHGAIGRNTEWRLLPDLVGMHIDQAKKTLREAGFPIEAPTQFIRRQVPGCKPDHVCSMYPQGLKRSSLRSGRAIVVGEAAQN